MATFLIGMMDRRNDLDYASYEAGAAETLEKYEVEALAVSNSPELLEGVAPSQRIVLLKFRDRKHLEDWYRSPEYQEVMPIRLRASDTRAVLVIEGLDNV